MFGVSKFDDNVLEGIINWFAAVSNNRNLGIATV
jgi:hypothetical protein